MNSNEQHYNYDNRYDIDIDENDNRHYCNEREHEEEDVKCNQQRRQGDQKLQEQTLTSKKRQQQHEQQQKKELETITSSYNYSTVVDSNSDNNDNYTALTSTRTGTCNNIRATTGSSVADSESMKGQSSQHGTSSSNNDTIRMMHTSRDYNDISYNTTGSRNPHTSSTDIVVRSNNDNSINTNTNTIHNHPSYGNHCQNHPTGSNGTTDDDRYNTADTNTNTTNENEHLLGIAFVSFLSFAIIQMIFAFIAQSQSMKGDSAAMLVDSLTYLFNYIAEKLKQRIQQRKRISKENEKDGIIVVSESDNDQQSKQERKLLLQLEIIPPLLSVFTLLIITIMVLDKAVHVLLIDLHNDSLLLQQQLHPNSAGNTLTIEIIPQSPSTIPNMSIMLFFSTLNLLLDGVNVFYFAKAKHLMGYTTVSNTDDIDHIDHSNVHCDQEAQHQLTVDKDHMNDFNHDDARSEGMSYTNTDTRDYNKYRYIARTTTVTNAGSSNIDSSSQLNDDNQEECDAVIPVPVDIHSTCIVTTAPPIHKVFYSPKFRKQTLSSTGSNTMTKTTTSTSTTTTACLSPKRTMSAGSVKNSLGMSGVPMLSSSSPASAAIIITRTTTTNKKCATCDIQNRNGMNNNIAGTTGTSTTNPTSTLNGSSNTGKNTIVEETTTTTTTTMMVSSNLNMCSAYTHVIADTIRSIAVIFAAVTVLVFQPPNVSPEEADSIAAIIVSFVIIGSLLPLLRGLYVSISEYYLLCYPIIIQPLSIVVVDNKSTIETKTNINTNTNTNTNTQIRLPLSISMQSLASSSLYDDNPTVQVAIATNSPSSSLQQQQEQEQEQSSCNECKYTVV